MNTRKTSITDFLAHDWKEFLNPTPVFFEGQFAEGEEDTRTDEEIQAEEVRDEVAHDHALDNQF